MAREILSMPFLNFHYNSLDELKTGFESVGKTVPFSERTSVLARPLRIRDRYIPNRIGYHPMEGADGNADGSPSEYTWRRYERFARGGAGLIWMEAIAVAEEGRANPLQLWLRPENVKQFRMLNDHIRRCAKEEFGADFQPLLIAQLTHSGRFSRPHSVSCAEPLITYHNPYLNTKLFIDPDMPVLSDTYIDSVHESIVRAASLASEAGFDGVDIKCCHRYLLSELCSAFLRGGRYGGSFENRTRMITECIRDVRQMYGKELLVCSRLNIYDGIPYPYGFGTDRNDFTKYDLTEPRMLIRRLINSGLDLLNITMGTPYYNSHVNRPFDQGLYIPDESQLIGVARMINGISEIAHTFPELPIVGTGYTYLRQFGAFAAAGSVETGGAAIAGFGRQSFAYPDFAKDILRNGRMDSRKVCITCGKCSDIMRLGNYTGCVVRDSEFYAPMYRKVLQNK